MFKLLSALTESLDADERSKLDVMYNEIIQRIRKDCAKFLASDSPPLYRGLSVDGHLNRSEPSKNNINDLLHKKFIRTNRKPRDNTKSANALIDDTIEGFAGFRPRSQSLFTSPEQGTANIYGAVAIVFPIGNYSTIYSPQIVDVYGDLFAGAAAWADGLAQLMAPLIHEEIHNNLEEYKYYVMNPKEYTLDELMDMWPYTLSKVFSLLSAEMQERIFEHLITKHWKKLFIKDDLSSLAPNSKNEVMIHNDDGYYYIFIDVLHNIFDSSVEELYKKLRT